MPSRRRFSTWTYLGILKRQRMICACGCGVRLERGNIQFDHLDELADGGADDPANLRALRDRPCHKAKTKKHQKLRAKGRRIRAQDGLLKKKPNQRERLMAARQRYEKMP